MGRKLIQIELADALGDLIIDRLEELDLHRRGLGRQLLGDGVLGRFVQRQDLPRALDHAHRQRGQARDLDAVAAVRRARLDAAQKQDLIAGFLDRDVQIADAFELAGELGQLVIVRGEEVLARMWRWMCSITAQASARPS